MSFNLSKTLSLLASTQACNIGVSKQYHRSGIGRLLTSSLLEHARLKGITGLEGGIIKNNTPSMNLFNHFGFDVGYATFVL